MHDLPDAVQQLEPRLCDRPALHGLQQVPDLFRVRLFWTMQEFRADLHDLKHADILRVVHLAPTLLVCSSALGTLLKVLHGCIKAVCDPGVEACCLLQTLRIAEHILRWVNKVSKASIMVDPISNVVWDLSEVKLPATETKCSSFDQFEPREIMRALAGRPHELP